MKHARLMVRTAVLLLTAVVLTLSMVTTGSADPGSVIDFEGLIEGATVSSLSSGAGISGDPVGGSVTVLGVHPGVPANRAMIFDATCGGDITACSGGDDDLYWPALGNVLIISTDGDGTDPDDADVVGARFDFDYSGLGSGTVTVNSIDALDIELPQGEGGASVELFAGGAGGSSLATVFLPNTGDNGLATVAIGVSGVDFMRVTLNGSGAIDNIDIEPEDDGGGEGCTPGFWKQEQHFDSWVGYSPSDLYDDVFGVDAPGNMTLLDALERGGGGERALGRHAVAALLNASRPDVDYAYSVAEVRAMVQEAYASGDFEGAKDSFEYENELGCPLD